MTPESRAAISLGVLSWVVRHMGCHFPDATVVKEIRRIGAMLLAYDPKHTNAIIDRAYSTAQEVLEC